MSQQRERCMILTLKKAFIPLYFQAMRYSTSSKRMFPCFRKAKCTVSFSLKVVFSFMAAKILGWRSGKRVVLAMRCVPHVVISSFSCYKEPTIKLSAAFVSYSYNSGHLIYFLRNQSSYLLCIFSTPSMSATHPHKPKKPI